ncbi:MAG: hypothetical protein MUF28_10710 [Ignavibacterium sp.]|nr:hypothetical protein [Ignavibacterium sp.]
MILVHAIGCSEKSTSGLVKTSTDNEFLSEQYNHFEGGILYTDIELGLDLLWNASFKNGRLYKENIGFFIDGGLLILPNRNNTRTSSSYSSVYCFTKDNKLFVEFNGNYVQVLGIIHTHPDEWGIQTPTNKHDYQFSYLGIHNYIISKYDLFDAYKAANGMELYDRLGTRKNYSAIPFVKSDIEKVIVVSN